MKEVPKSQRGQSTCYPSMRFMSQKKKNMSLHPLILLCMLQVCEYFHGNADKGRAYMDPGNLGYIRLAVDKGPRQTCHPTTFQHWS